MTPEEEQIINETCQKAADRIEELEAQLSSKEQECEELKSEIEYMKKNRRCSIG